MDRSEEFRKSTFSNQFPFREGNTKPRMVTLRDKREEYTRKYVHEASMVLSEQSQSVHDISYRPSDFDLLRDDAKFDMKIEKMTPTLNPFRPTSKFSASVLQTSPNNNDTEPVVTNKSQITRRMNKFFQFKTQDHLYDQTEATNISPKK